MGEGNTANILGKENNRAATLPILCWMVFELRKLKPIHDFLDGIAVLSVSYAGYSYPSIGWRLQDYSQREIADVIVEAEISRLLHNLPMQVFLHWLDTCDINWNDSYRLLFE